MKIIYLSAHNIQRLVVHHAIDCTFYRYVYAGLSHSPLYPAETTWVFADRYRLIDVAYRDYTKPERVKIRW